MPERLVTMRPARIMYGTDFPILPYAWDRELSRIARAGFSDATLEQVDDTDPRLGAFTAYVAPGKHVVTFGPGHADAEPGEVVVAAGEIVVARPYSRRPLRSAYHLTATGRDLAGALRLLSQWGADAAGPGSGTTAPAHQTCGTQLEVRWWCPTCDHAVEGQTEEEEGTVLWV